MISLLKLINEAHVPPTNFVSQTNGKQFITDELPPKLSQLNRDKMGA